MGDGELNPDKTIPKQVCNILDACTPPRISLCPLDLPQAPDSSSPILNGVILGKFARWRTILEDGVTEN